MYTPLFSLAAGLTLTLLSGLPSSSPYAAPKLDGDKQALLQAINTGDTKSLTPAQGFETFGSFDKARSFHPQIEFFETVLSYGPTADPRNMLLLLNHYLIANQHKQGIHFLERLFEHYNSIMDSETKAAYLASYAILRATYADEIPLLRRIQWINKTFDILDEAHQLADKNRPIVRWAAGLIYAQVPWFFGKQDEAIAELTWLAQHPESEPIPGFYREVYHYLGKLHADKGNTVLAEKYLKKSGYDRYEPSTLFMGWFTATQDQGLTFAPSPWIEEVVPNKVFAVRGFGFSELHFAVSANNKALISIDAGTQPFSFEAGYQFLKQNYPDLPSLTTVFITHAHWDHIGGYTALENINSDVKIYGRENYHAVLKRVRRNHSYKLFRSQSFKDEWIKNYQPDVVIDQLTDITIDGTHFVLIPVTGGETEDAMLIYMPAEQVIFSGDVVMPYYGEPWVEEGFLDEAIATMDEIINRNPKHVLHGHYGLTFMYGTEEMKIFRDAYSWLVNASRKYIANGYSVKEIVRLNLIPPGLQNHPPAFLGYIAPRDHIIARVADHMLGIWQENVAGNDPTGLDNLTTIEYGRLLKTYLSLSEGEIKRALRKMLDAGDNELALKMAIAAEEYYPKSQVMASLKEEAADRLRSAGQFFDPFKFVVYTEIINKEHMPITTDIVERVEQQ